MINAHEESLCKAQQDLSTPKEIVKEVIELGKQIGATIIGDETPVKRRITRSLRNKMKKESKLSVMC